MAQYAEHLEAELNSFCSRMWAKALSFRMPSFRKHQNRICFEVPGSDLLEEEDRHAEILR